MKNKYIIEKMKNNHNKKNDAWHGKHECYTCQDIYEFYILEPKTRWLRSIFKTLNYVVFSKYNVLKCLKYCIWQC